MKTARRVRSGGDQDVADLRRAVGVIGHAPLRQRLLRVVDDLERDAGWDSVAEIRASRELDAVREERDVARATVERCRAAMSELTAELASARRERDRLAQRLVELRELAPDDLADALVEIRVRSEAEHPTRPPLIPLRQAARLVLAVRSQRRPAD